MKKNQSPSIQSILAGIGVGSLLIYVLACATSFSPDDRQVLYPSFDPQSGATSVAVYDRRTGHSETLFTAIAAGPATNQEPVLLRAEWLPDGKHVLIAQAVGNDGLDLFVLPRGVKDTTRHFCLGKIDDAAMSLEFPFAVTGGRLFINGSERDPLWVNLTTGEAGGGDKDTNEVVVLPSPDGKSLIGLRDRKDKGQMEFGTFDPTTCQFQPVGRTGTNSADGNIPAFNPADGRWMFISKAGDQLQLQTGKGDKTEFARQLAHGGDDLEVGPFLDLSRDGKTVLTAYSATSAATTNCEYGLLEIPLDDSALRFTPLINAKQSDKSDLIFAQPSLSHDGKTWAIATTFLYLQNESVKADDCALFLVDLSKSKRPVTKVPIQVPTQRKRLVH